MGVREGEGGIGGSEGLVGVREDRGVANEKKQLQKKIQQTSTQMTMY